MPLQNSSFLETTYAQQQALVAAHHINHEKVWLKKAGKRHARWIYLPLQWISKILGLSMLAPVPNAGGSAAILCEAHRLKVLAQHGINVPTVLAVNDHAILLKDVASEQQSVAQLERVLRHSKSFEQRLAIYQHVLEEIQVIHQKKMYLSEAFARNILITNDEKIFFIDFETDPAEILSLHDCYVRDWLCLIFSTADCFEFETLKNVAQTLVDTLQTEPDVLSDLLRVARKISWLGKLNIQGLGSDGRRLHKCVELLHLLKEQA